MRLFALMGSLASVVLCSASFAQETGEWTVDPELDVAIKGVTAESAIRDDEETIDGDAIAFRLSPSASIANENIEIVVRNSATRIEYFEEDRTDRWQNVARVSAELQTDESGSIMAFAERGDNLSTAEFSRTDEWEFGARVERELSRSNRLRLGASWRDRHYDDLAQSTGAGPQLDGEFRHRVAANHYIYARGRYEEIDSGNPIRDMSRWTVAASYQRPIGPDLRIRPEIAYRDLDYPGRIVADGTYRQDDILTPEVTLLYSPGPWLVVAEARYIVRNSNDPAFDREGYRVSFEVGYEF